MPRNEPFDVNRAAPRADHQPWQPKQFLTPLLHSLLSPVQGHGQLELQEQRLLTLVETLLSLRADPNKGAEVIEAGVSRFRRPLHLSKSLAMTKLLLAARARPDANALENACVQPCAEEMVQLMLDARADVGGVTQSGKQPFELKDEIRRARHCRLMIRDRFVAALMPMLTSVAFLPTSVADLVVKYIVEDEQARRLKIMKEYLLDVS